MALGQLLLLQRAREAEPLVGRKHEVTVDLGRREPGSRQTGGLASWTLCLGQQHTGQMRHLPGGLAQGRMWPCPTFSLTHLLVKHPVVTGTCIPCIGGWPRKDFLPLDTEQEGRKGEGADSAWRGSRPSGPLSLLYPSPLLLHPLCTPQPAEPLCPRSVASCRPCPCAVGSGGKQVPALTGPSHPFYRWGSGGRSPSTCVTVFCQITVGAGSPEMGTSRRSLFPATTTIVSGVRPGQSRWILGGSGVAGRARWRGSEEGEGPVAPEIGGNWFPFHQFYCIVYTHYDAETQAYNLMSFDKCIYQCNHHQANQDLEHSITPGGSRGGW